jgi:hypothetical protein
MVTMDYYKVLTMDYFYIFANIKITALKNILWCEAGYCSCSLYPVYV